MHIPVLLQEVIHSLQPLLLEKQFCLDATFGAGGYTSAILSQTDAGVIAIDRDKSVLPLADNIALAYKERFCFIQGDFGNLEAYNLPSLSAAVFDLGVSSMQIDQAERGFSFYQDGPLDMRMDQALEISAAQLVNTLPQEDIAYILFSLGDEHLSRRIASAIVRERGVAPFETTLRLATCIAKAVGKKKGRTHTATKSFQALRIYVNDELNQLQKGLEAVKNILAPGGRIAVVTFHSGEDKIVKKLFNDWCGKVESSWDKHLPFEAPHSEPTFKFITKKPVAPSLQEIHDNPRARSAKLRVVEKLKG